MEVLSFYWPNMLAGMVLVFVLSMLGRHLVARNQSMEVMLLGQEFQTGILIAAFAVSLIDFGEHQDHGFHLEALFSIGIVLILHFFFSIFTKKQRRFRIEGAIVMILMLMGFSHMVVLFSPIVEFHMVKSYLGDIVTVSRVEAISVAIISCGLYLVFAKYETQIMRDTLEIALFNKPTKKRTSMLVFNIIVLLLMLQSIHLFGTIFTVAAMIIPSLVTAVFQVNKTKFFWLGVLNALSVVLAFVLLTYVERLPTTVAIVFIIFIISLIFSCLYSEK